MDEIKAKLLESYLGHKIISRGEEEADYKLRKEEIMSVYNNHYESAKNKFATVEEFIAIRNEIRIRNEELEKYLEFVINSYRNIQVEGGEQLLKIIEDAYSHAGIGRRIKKEYQDQIVSLANELFDDEKETSKIKFTLEEFIRYADSTIKEFKLNDLILEIIDNNYPSSLKDIDSKSYTGNNDDIETAGPYFSVVKNIIHEMAVKRAGPDKRSTYEYGDIFNALTKKYNNPGLRYKDLNTPIGESSFSTMWTILNEKINDIDISEVD